MRKKCCKKSRVLICFSVVEHLTLILQASKSEEITYITYHTPVRQESDMLKRRGNTEPDEDQESDQETESPVQVASRPANHSAAPAGGAWKLIRLLLLLAALAAALYYAFCRVLDKEDPSNIQ
ncbi:emerin (Emery-Dreifuss muscular dystrophy) isoform X3 [Pungitius pungitius]|uniref:emerin (Emery-Dreifuss muscular dystrophy) isoform X3 n=1 Tax=Pungitius pungitius TaxID=134920 RepID=UPI0018883402|nr:emerin (Emery-Dreifuss muscular dystrophy) isoform X3 [Pungitius pungitius]